MIDTAQYRATIGVFLCIIRSNSKSLCSELFFWNFIYQNFLFRIIVLPRLIELCGDIELNPGPSKQAQYCHINLRSITADGDTTYGTTKFLEFEAFIASYDFDIIGITETWLDATITNEKNNFRKL